eukprot:TRINITY_DN4927_c0_g2_i1.p1 TRINITY_DN4927_c0_g2~~TRINITY_DN4927_c0_g2_i1.p1  ORF type:complete len:158 (-),score=50.79 TRINITY_DN4927_c0_g2_i1:658-1131(-)
MTIPMFFEDNIEQFMGLFHQFLTFDSGNNKEILEGEDFEEGILHKIQAQICENISLYIEKYEEEFKDCLQGFVDDVWGLLTTTPLDDKYDNLVIQAIGFLTSVSKGVYHHLFKDDGTLKQICEKVIIPNMMFREIDEENFEDNPVEYIRRDIEGSDR